MDGVMSRRSSRNVDACSASACSFLSCIRKVAILTNTLMNGKNSITHTTLKNVWNMAICVSGSSNHAMKVMSLKLGQSSNIIVKSIVPNTLNIRWMSAARLAFVFAPMEERSAVTHVPMLDPRTMNNTLFPPLPIVSPAPTMAMMMVVTAEDDCIIAVNAIPMNSSSRGLDMLVSRSLNASLVRNTSMEELMNSRPTNTSPRPPRIYPIV